MAGEPETLDTDEPLARRMRRHSFDRLIMLSDGVFAIAITLLAFDLHGPGVWDGRLASLGSDLLPKLGAYALSFVVISVYWLAHRRMMAVILTVDPPVTIINLVTLALVALLPAATQMAQMRWPQTAVMMVYSALVVAIGVSLAALWGYAALVANLVAPEVPRRVRWFLLLLMIFTPTFFLLLTAAVPNPGPIGVPAILIVLFMIGWPMRAWIVRRLSAKPAAEPASGQGEG